MANLKLVVDEAIPYLRGMAEHLGTVRYLPGAAITAADVADAAAFDFDGNIINVNISKA